MTLNSCTSITITVTVAFLFYKSPEMTVLFLHIAILRPLHELCLIASFDCATARADDMRYEDAQNHAALGGCGQNTGQRDTL
jgi:hypothetical protein